MPSLLSKPAIADFIVTEANGQMSRDNIQVAVPTAAALESGTVLSKQAAAATYAVDADAAGNPTCGTITRGATAKDGVYTLVFKTATTFDLIDPDGLVASSAGATGSPLTAGGLTFTITVGANAMTEDDMCTITVVTGRLYKAYANGDTALGVLYRRVEPMAAHATKTNAQDAVIFNAHCELRRGALVGLDAAAEEDLASLGIKVRGASGLPHVSTPALT